MADINNPPLSTPVIDLKTGKMSSTWAGWFLRLYERVGGAIGGNAPLDAAYITRTASTDLVNEQSLSTLSSGFMKVTSGSGVITSTANINTSDIANNAVTTAKLDATGITATSYGSSEQTLSVTTDVSGRLTAISSSLISIPYTYINNLSSWPGSTGITTLGTITTGTWNGATIETGYGGTGVTSLGNLTKTDDTNVTLTLGGTPTGALINSTSITAGWAGTLAVARGGTGSSTASGARSNLSAAVTGVNNDITSMTGLTGYLASPLGIKGSNNNIVVAFTDSLAASNYITISNSTAEAGFSCPGRMSLSLAGTVYITNSASFGALSGGVSFTSGNTGAELTLTAPVNMISPVIYTFPGTYGSSGQLLRTDSSGNLSWIDDSGANAPFTDFYSYTFAGGV